MLTGNYEVVRSLNTSLVLDTLRAAGELSRADLSRLTGLTTGTITNIISKLLGYGFVMEKGTAPAAGGRKPVLVKLNSDGGYAIGIEVSTSGVRGVLTNFTADPLHRLSRPGVFRYRQGLDAITELVSELEQSLGSRAEKLLGIGISVPGWVHFPSGKVHNLPSLSGWENVELKADLEQAVGRPVFVDNDANLAARGERWFGQGRNVDQLIYVLVEDGVGAGFVINHQTYHGQGYSVGELGHIQFAGGEEVCRCGRRGCLDTLASVSAIEKSYARLAGCCLSIEEIKLRLQLGDENAYKVFNTAAAALGQALAALINLLGPETIVLGGRVVRDNQRFVEAVKEAALKSALPVMAREVLLTVSHLQDFAGLLGGVALVFQSVLQPYALQAVGNNK